MKRADFTRKWESFVPDFKKLIEYETYIDSALIENNISKAHEYLDQIEQKSLPVSLHEFRLFNSKLKKLSSKEFEKLDFYIQSLELPECNSFPLKNPKMFSTSFNIDANQVFGLMKDFSLSNHFFEWDLLGFFIETEFKKMKIKKSRAWKFSGEKILIYLLIYKDDTDSISVYLFSYSESFIQNLESGLDSYFK